MQALSLIDPPKWQEKNVLVKKINSVGIYGINLFIRGKPWTISIDDYFVYQNVSAL